jgi:hypothetical protein
MKTLLRSLLLLIIGMAIGFALGRNTAKKPNPQELHAVAVDCYDSKGNLMPDQFAKFGGVQLSCSTGQTAKVRQSH